MEARHVAHWGTLTMVALFAVTGLEVRSPASVTELVIAVRKTVSSSCEHFGRAVSGHTAMHSMHCFQFSAM